MSAELLLCRAPSPTAVARKLPSFRSSQSGVFAVPVGVLLEHARRLNYGKVVARTSYEL